MIEEPSRQVAPRKLIPAAQTFNYLAQSFNYPAQSFNYSAQSFNYFGICVADCRFLLPSRRLMFSG